MAGLRRNHSESWLSSPSSPPQDLLLFRYTGETDFLRTPLGILAFLRTSENCLLTKIPTESVR